MQIMRVQKLVCHSHWRVHPGQGGDGDLAKIIVAMLQNRIELNRTGSIGEYVKWTYQNGDDAAS